MLPAFSSIGPCIADFLLLFPLTGMKWACGIYRHSSLIARTAFRLSVNSLLHRPLVGARSLDCGKYGGSSRSLARPGSRQPVSWPRQSGNARSACRSPGHRHPSIVRDRPQITNMAPSLRWPYSKHNPQLTRQHDGRWRLLGGNGYTRSARAHRHRRGVCWFVCRRLPLPLHQAPPPQADGSHLRGETTSKSPGAICVCSSIS